MKTSRIILHKGLAGLILEGSFLERTHLLRYSLGETFTLPLGIDPAINVLYGTPGVTKIFGTGCSRRKTVIHTRTITLADTRTTGRLIGMLVLDQNPVSEDGNP